MSNAGKCEGGPLDGRMAEQPGTSFTVTEHEPVVMRGPKTVPTRPKSKNGTYEFDAARSVWMWKGWET